MHWAKDCKSKFDIERKSIPRNSKQGTPPPGPRQQKPGANSIFSLKPSPSSSAAIDIPALNHFFLYHDIVQETGIKTIPKKKKCKKAKWLSEEALQKAVKRREV